MTELQNWTAYQSQNTSMHFIFITFKRENPRKERGIRWFPPYCGCSMCILQTFNRMTTIWSSFFDWKSLFRTTLWPRTTRLPLPRSKHTHTHTQIRNFPVGSIFCKAQNRLIKVTNFTLVAHLVQACFVYNAFVCVCVWRRRRRKQKSEKKRKEMMMVMIMKSMKCKCVQNTESPSKPDKIGSH